MVFKNLEDRYFPGIMRRLRKMHLLLRHNDTVQNPQELKGKQHSNGMLLANDS